MTTLARKLTPKQRQFWWRVAHRKYMTNNRAHKYKIDARGRAPNECNICKDGVETWDHMEYDCDGVRKWMARMEVVYSKYTGKDDWTIPTRQEWRLNIETGIPEDRIMTIAVARWVYHKHRCNVIHRQRRRLDLDLIDETQEEMSLIKEKETRDEKEKKEKEEKNQRRVKEKEKKEEEKAGTEEDRGVRGKEQQREE